MMRIRNVQEGDGDSIKSSSMVGDKAGWGISPGVNIVIQENNIRLKEAA